MLPRLSTSKRFTVAFCHERARECLALTLEGGSQPARQILEHIAESWSNIAAELAKTERSSQASDSHAAADDQRAAPARPSSPKDFN